MDLCDLTIPNTKNKKVRKIKLLGTNVIFPALSVKRLIWVMLSVTGCMRELRYYEGTHVHTQTRSHIHNREFV